jgi:hypothetical protein
MRLWTLPPVDVTNNTACLTRGWHGGDAQGYPSRGLDWKWKCGEDGSETVYLRVLGADTSVPFDGTWYAGMYARPDQLQIGDCGSVPAWQDSVHIAKVKLYQFEGLVGGGLIGHLLFGHTLMDNEGPIQIQFLRGASRSNAWYTSVAIGDTKKDGVDWTGPQGVPDGIKDATNCWSGWHAHENNSNDSPMYWNDWNDADYDEYDPPDLGGGNYENDDPANWTRRMEWQWFL